MQIPRILTWMINIAVVCALPMQKRSPLKRNTRSSATRVGCMHMESGAGEYRFVSDGSGNVCGLYLITLPDQLIELEFMDFNVKCAAGGLVALVDGWEMNGQFFPPPDDHHLTLEQRYMTFCGPNRPRKLFVSSQNVLLIQNRIPTDGEGFTVKVAFVENPQPCNAISMFSEGIHTLRNFGERKNCSLSIIYPEVIHFASVDVGVTAMMNEVEGSIGLSDKCFDRQGSSDYVEITGGNGFETSSNNRRGVACGLSTGADLSGVPVACTNTVVRLVSSGEFYNSATFMYTQPTAEQLLEDPVDFKDGGVGFITGGIPFLTLIHPQLPHVVKGLLTAHKFSDQ